MTLGFHPLADRELTEAAQFYEGQAGGLGGDFLDEIQAMLDLLRSFPELGRPLGGTLRSLPTRRFPYSLVYDLQPDYLRILAVAHHRRRPRYWIGRTGS